MDLIWPKSLSVNNGVDKDKYLNTPYLLNYPSIDNITASLCKLGPAAQLFKIDISRAFCQIQVDPGDIDLLGLQINDQYFIDLSIILMISFLLACPQKIHLAYEFLQNLLSDPGLDISYKKLVPLSTSVVCLGILIDTVARTISILPKKLQDIVNMCKNCETKTYCSKNHLQLLLGSLLYVTKCVKPARIFLNRILQLLRDNFENTKIILTANFFKDLAWFNVFSKIWHGSMFSCLSLMELPTMTKNFPESPSI